MDQKLRLGIMGGTFDPIHYGHLLAAEAVRTECGLDRVLFMPSGNPPHKKVRTVSDAQHRFMMTVLATLTNPHFKVSRIELDRPGYSYAVDTVAEVARIFPDSEITFITGADAILEILTWKDVEALMQKCKFIAVTRSGFNLDELKELPQQILDQIDFWEIPAIDVSSTQIRKRVQAGKTIRYLVPQAVEYYIQKHQLYR